MQKRLAMILALILLCAAVPAHAWIYIPESIRDYENLPLNPHLSYFAVLRAWPEPGNERIVNVQVSEPVDELYVNWMGHGEEPMPLTLDENLQAFFFFSDDHKYQPGAAPVTKYKRQVNLNSTVVIPFGASDELIEAARKEARRFTNEYCPCVSVEKPHWEVRRPLMGGTYCVITSYDQDYPASEIKVPAGAVLVPVNGCSYAWRQVFLSSDGWPNDAYLTLQKGWYVVYDRTGNIRYYYKVVEDTEYFGLGPASAVVVYEEMNGAWHCREVTEMYDDGSHITAYYSKTGSGKLVSVESQGISEPIWPVRGE